MPTLTTTYGFILLFIIYKFFNVREVGGKLSLYFFREKDEFSDKTVCIYNFLSFCISCIYMELFIPSDKGHIYIYIYVCNFLQLLKCLLSFNVIEVTFSYC